MIIECKGCNKEFNCEVKKYNFNIKNNIGIYCSQKCYLKSKVKSIEVDCSNCGKKVLKTPTAIRLSKTGNLYCSRNCAVIKNNTLFRSGENHPNFYNGSGSYRSRKLSSCENKCEDCGIDDIRVLQIHHKDENRKNNKLENLTILCANCHLIRHSLNIE